VWWVEALSAGPGTGAADGTTPGHTPHQLGAHYQSALPDNRQI